MEENKNSNKKNAIIGLVAIVAVVLVLVVLFKLVGPSPAKTVKKYCKLMNKGELLDVDQDYILTLLLLKLLPHLLS